VGNEVLVTANQPPTGPPLDRVRVLTEEAVDVTSTAYTEDAGLDVDARLREEMTGRGLPAEDGWIAHVAQAIRSGHHLSFDDPGSVGG
jgi:hypothetical protein